MVSLALEAVTALPIVEKIGGLHPYCLTWANGIGPELTHRTAAPAAACIASMSIGAAIRATKRERWDRQDLAVLNDESSTPLLLVPPIWAKICPLSRL